MNTPPIGTVVSMCRDFYISASEQTLDTEANKLWRQVARNPMGTWEKRLHKGMEDHYALVDLDPLVPLEVAQGILEHLGLYDITATTPFTRNERGLIACTACHAIEAYSIATILRVLRIEIQQEDAKDKYRPEECRRALDLLSIHTPFALLESVLSLTALIEDDRINAWRRSLAPFVEES